MNQLKKMFKKTRVVVTIVFLGAMIATLLVAFLMPETPEKANPTKRLLIMSLIIVQFCAYIWYSLSYIPFGRALAKKCCKKCVKDAKGDN